MWLEWEPAALVVFVLVGVVIALRPVAARWADVVGAFARELAIMFTLYAVWRLAAQLSLMQVDGAVWRGRWLWDVQRALHLPSEVSVQHLVLPHPLLVQGANVYYAVAHVPAMILFLAWLFTFHRPRYPKIRNAMALTTGACLLIQLIPVAPPVSCPVWASSTRRSSTTSRSTVASAPASRRSCPPCPRCTWRGRCWSASAR